MSLGLLAIMLDEIKYVDRWWGRAIKDAAAIGCCFDQVIVVDGESADGTADRLRELRVPVITRAFAGN